MARKIKPNVEIMDTDYSFYRQKAKIISFHFTVNEFKALLSIEPHSLTLSYLLRELNSQWEAIEAYEYCACIKAFFDKNQIEL